MARQFYSYSEQYPQAYEEVVGQQGAMRGILERRRVRDCERRARIGLVEAQRQVADGGPRARHTLPVDDDAQVYMYM